MGEQRCDQCGSVNDVRYVPDPECRVHAWWACGFCRGQAAAPDDRAVVLHEVVAALAERFGPDNVDGYEGQPWRIGVSIDGTIVDVTIGGPSDG